MRFFCMRRAIALPAAQKLFFTYTTSFQMKSTFLFSIAIMVNAIAIHGLSCYGLRKQYAEDGKLVCVGKMYVQQNQ